MRGTKAIGKKEIRAKEVYAQQGKANATMSLGGMFVRIMIRSYASENEKRELVGGAGSFEAKC